MSNHANPAPCPSEEPEQLDLFPEYAAEQIMNPMIRSFGTGPQGTKCKTCRFLFAKSYSKVYFKCEHRGNSNGPGTDHRMSWQSCRLYEEACL